MKNYVYRITNINESKHYYGVRTAKNRSPEEDLGIKYFSSSTDTRFMEEQKAFPKNFKYKIVRKFESRIDAASFEIYLHKKFNVALNKSFYNKHNQKSERFSISTPESIAKGVNTRGNDIIDGLNSYQRGGKKTAEKLKGKAIYYDENGNSISINVKEAKDRNLICTSLGRKHSDETKNLFSIQRIGNQFKKGIKENKETKLKKSKIASEQNTQAKNILIYNDSDELIYNCFSNFKKTCKKYKLPYNALRESFRKNSKIEFSNYSKISQPFVGWYAKEIKK